MTDEQAALIAAALALSADPSRHDAASSDDLDDLADAIATLARALLPGLREQSEDRDHAETLDRLGQLSQLVNRREAAR